MQNATQANRQNLQVQRILMASAGLFLFAGLVWTLSKDRLHLDRPQQAESTSATERSGLSDRHAELVSRHESLSGFGLLQADAGRSKTH